MRSTVGAMLRQGKKSFYVGKKKILSLVKKGRPETEGK